MNWGIKGTDTVVILRATEDGVDSYNNPIFSEEEINMQVARNRINGDFYAVAGNSARPADADFSDDVVSICRHVLMVLSDGFRCGLIKHQPPHNVSQIF